MIGERSVAASAGALMHYHQMFAVNFLIYGLVHQAAICCG